MSWKLEREKNHHVFILSMSKFPVWFDFDFPLNLVLHLCRQSNNKAISIIYSAFGGYAIILNGVERNGLFVKCLPICVKSSFTIENSHFTWASSIFVSFIDLFWKASKRMCVSAKFVTWLTLHSHFTVCVHFLILLIIRSRCHSSQFTHTSKFRCGFYSHLKFCGKRWHFDLIILNC